MKKKGEFHKIHQLVLKCSIVAWIKFGNEFSLIHPPPPSKMVKKSNSSWPGYHVAARVGKLHVRNGGDDFREKRPKTTTNIIMLATIKGAM